MAKISDEGIIDKIDESEVIHQNFPYQIFPPTTVSLLLCQFSLNANSLIFSLIKTHHKNLICHLRSPCLMKLLPYYILRTGDFELTVDLNWFPALQLYMYVFSVALCFELSMVHLWPSWNFFSKHDILHQIARAAWGCDVTTHTCALTQ